MQIDVKHQKKAELMNSAFICKDKKWQCSMKELISGYSKRRQQAVGMELSWKQSNP